MSTDRELLEDERDAVLRQLDDRTNKTWVMKRKRWATLIRDQDSVIQQLTDELAAVRAAAAIGAQAEGAHWRFFVRPGTWVGVQAARVTIELDLLIEEQQKKETIVIRHGRISNRSMILLSKKAMD